MKLFSAIILCICSVNFSFSQEYFTITQYDVNVKVNKDASLDVTEKLYIHFNEPRHGIKRQIPYRYKLEPLPAGSEKADRQLESNGYTNIFIQNIQVQDHNFSVRKVNDSKEIKIGSASEFVSGDQEYVINYKVLNAINFFENYSEFYFNLIPPNSDVASEYVNFSIELYEPLADEPAYFIATGAIRSQENNTISKWSNNKVFSGSTTETLKSYEGLTIGIKFPKDFLIKPDYSLLEINWLFMPVIVFGFMFLIWRKWGKDEKLTVQTEFYPPSGISPSVAGYLIDDRLNKRDLTALIPYWGAGGYLKVEETEKSELLGIIKNKDYIFTKLKELPDSAMQFEKALFKGIFASGKEVKLSSLKNVLYTKMEKAKQQLEYEVTSRKYYVKNSRGLRTFFIVIGILGIVFGPVSFVIDLFFNIWPGIAFMFSGIIAIIFGALMPKKSGKGNEVYQKLLGFKEFIKLVEKDKLKEFLRQDEHYFDTVLPFAIVFGIADTWKDKLEGLDIPPPTWYTGNYAMFNTAIFMRSLDRSMNAMSDNFYSKPSSSGSSGSSWSGGGGGFSGGGFGGGSVSSW